MAVVAVGWCSECVTSSVNQAHRHTVRNCSIATSCHRNVPIVEKLRDRARKGRKRKRERERYAQSGRTSKEKDVQVIFHHRKQLSCQSVPQTPFIARPLIQFCIMNSMYACVCVFDRELKEQSNQLVKCVFAVVFCR